MIVFTIDDIIAIAILTVIGFVLLANLIQELVRGSVDKIKDRFSERGRKE